MRFYAIGYEQIGDTFKFYAYTCKFLSERREVDSDSYFEIKSSFPMAGKNNKTLSGIYFPEGL